MKVESIVDAAEQAANTALKEMKDGQIERAHLALIESAIYTIGAEVCGRLDFIISRRINGGKRKKSDSKFYPESTGAADSSIGKERTST